MRISKAALLICATYSAVLEDIESYLQLSVMLTSNYAYPFITILVQICSIRPFINKPTAFCFLILHYISQLPDGSGA